MRKIYLASSWRNELQPEYVENLRKLGHEVYDFRNPIADNTGFHWSEVGVNSKIERNDNFLRGLEHQISMDGFRLDYEGMMWADTCVMLLPCGKSAHLELGWFIGQFIKTIVHNPMPHIEPELMYKLADRITYTVDQLKDALNANER